MQRERVNIESLAHGGDGVAKLPDGRTLFVRGACPGDDLTATITESHDRWARGVVHELHEASPDRVEAPCPYFGECGGCQWQHVFYAAQLRAKKRAVFDSLTRIGKIEEPDVAEPLPSPSEYGYRNKIELTASTEARGLTLGFARIGTGDVLPIDACLLLPESAAHLPKSLAGALRFLATRGATGIARVSLKVSSRGEIAVDVWTPPGPFPRPAAARVISEATGATSVTRVLFRGAVERRDVSNVEILSGPGTWSETLDGDRYTVSAPSFFQVNSGAAASLRTLAVDAVQADGTTRVGDLYAGAGTFTLPLARASGATLAIESSRWALSDLRRNLAAAGVQADVLPGDAAYALTDAGHLDAAIVDPPRAGLAPKALHALAEARIGRLVYVSCDPATLARDVMRLSEAGYMPTRFSPVDLFPQSFHVETVAVLERG